MTFNKMGWRFQEATSWVFNANGVYGDDNWCWQGAVFEHIRAQPAFPSKSIFEEVVTPIVKRSKPVVKVENCHDLII